MQFVWLFTFLSSVLVPLAKKLLVGLGIGAVTYVGINVVMNEAKAYLLQQMAGLPSDVAQLLGVFKFDIAINIMLSAVATRLVLSGVSSLGKKTDLTSVSK